MGLHSYAVKGNFSFLFFCLGYASQVKGTNWQTGHTRFYEKNELRHACLQGRRLQFVNEEESLATNSEILK